MNSAKKFAEWFLMRNRRDALECEDNFLNPMQLQKLLYYAQGYHLGCYGEALFPEEIKAWPWGPVVPQVYNEYRRFRGAAIDVVYDCSDEDFAAAELRTLNIVYDKYSRYSGIELSRMTHAEMPWQSTKLYGTVSKDKMAEFFEDVMLSAEEEEELVKLKEKAEGMPIVEFKREAYL